MCAMICEVKIRSMSRQRIFLMSAMPRMTFAGMYETGIFHSDGTQMEMCLAYSDIALFDGTRSIISDFNKDDFLVEELQVKAKNYIEESLELPAYQSADFNTCYIRHERNGELNYVNTRMKKKSILMRIFFPTATRKCLLFQPTTQTPTTTKNATQPHVHHWQIQ